MHVPHRVVLDVLNVTSYNTLAVSLVHGLRRYSIRVSHGYRILYSSTAVAGSLVHGLRTILMLKSLMSLPMTFPGGRSADAGGSGRGRSRC